MEFTYTDLYDFMILLDKQIEMYQEDKNNYVSEFTGARPKKRLSRKLVDNINGFEVCAEFIGNNYTIDFDNWWRNEEDDDSDDDSDDLEYKLNFTFREGFSLKCIVTNHICKTETTKYFTFKEGDDEYDKFDNCIFLLDLLLKHNLIKNSNQKSARSVVC